MSAQGDASFMRRFRDSIQTEIEAEMVRLVSITNERKAGHVQGLMDALELANTIYAEMSGEDRTPPNRQPGVHS